MSHSALRAVFIFLLCGGIGLRVAALPNSESSGSIRSVHDFDRVEIEIGGEVLLTQGSSESLEITASPDDLSRISTVVRAGTLRIGLVRQGDSPRGRVTCRLSMKTISSLQTSSSGSIRAALVNADRLRIAIHSSGAVAIESLKARALDVEVSSSGSCTLAGTVERQTVRLSSSGEYRAPKLASRETSVELSSSGGAEISVSERLDARISSSGNVRYHGNPPSVTSTATSSGKLVKLN